MSAIKHHFHDIIEIKSREFNSVELESMCEFQRWELASYLKIENYGQMGELELVNAILDKQKELRIQPL